MGSLSPYFFIGAAIVVLIVSSYHFHSWSNSATARRSRSPLWLGFTVSSAAIVLFVAGVVGLDLSYLHGLFAGTKWVEGVVWWQVLLGLALAPVAVLLLRRGVRDLNQELRRA